MWNQSKIFPVVRATLAITIDKVPATHVASPKATTPPCLVAGAGREHLPEVKPKPQILWEIAGKPTYESCMNISSTTQWDRK